GVENEKPLAGTSLHEVKLGILVSHVDQDVEIGVVLPDPGQKERKGFFAHLVPANVVPPEAASAEGPVTFPGRDHPLEEAENVGVHRLAVPVYPAGGVVLVVRIVVPPLEV